MKAKDILQVKQREPITVSPKTNLKEAMKLLITNRISCLPVLSDDSQLVGIISDKDIFKAIYENPDSFSAMPVGDNMSTNLIVGLADDELNYIAGLMTNNRIRHIPIVKDRQLIGLVSVGDIVKSQMTDIEVENRYLKIYIEGSYPA